MSEYTEDEIVETIGQKCSLHITSATFIPVEVLDVIMLDDRYQKTLCVAGDGELIIAWGRVPNLNWSYHNPTELKLKYL